nr:uncharacterized protein LOC118683228 [Bactrocera oleae]
MSVFVSAGVFLYMNFLLIKRTEKIKPKKVSKSPHCDGMRRSSSTQPQQQQLGYVPPRLWCLPLPLRLLLPQAHTNTHIRGRSRSILADVQYFLVFSASNYHQQAANNGAITGSC